MEHVIDVAEVVVQVPAFLCGPVLCGNPVVYGGRTAEINKSRRGLCTRP